MTDAAVESMGQVAEGQQYVTFSLNDEEYAIDAINVQEIIELANITKIPHLPAHLRGVINLRGTIIPVVDMKMKFGMSALESRKHTCVIVAEYAGGIMGLIVDAVSDVLHMPSEAISAAPSFGTRVNTEFIKGLGKVNGRLVLVLDLDRVLSEDEALSVSGMSECPPACS